MSRKGKVSAVIALCCTAAGVALTGCEEAPTAGSNPSASNTASAATDGSGGNSFTGTKKIEVAGKSVNVSCSGQAAEGRPVIVLLHGGGDSLRTMADLQETLSAEDRVCSYDRLGAGGSDQPDGPQTLESTGEVLTGVIDQVVGDAPVVLAGHSLGGLIAGRYAPDHQDTVKGLVLMDATSPTQAADLAKGIPASATGPAATVRDRTVAILEGKGPEKLATPDGEVRSAGDIPVEVLQHGKPYFAAAVPGYGEALEEAWSQGQRAWLAISSRSNLSTAVNSGHHVYVDEPEVAVRAIQRIVTETVN